MDPSLVEIAKGLGVAAPFVMFLIWLVQQQAKTIREKDAHAIEVATENTHALAELAKAHADEIARLNDGNRALIERVAPLLQDTARTLGDATAELRRQHG